MDDKLLNNILTTRDLTDVKRELDNLNHELFKGSSNKAETILENTLRSWLSSYILDNCGTNINEIEKFIDNLDKQLTNFKVIKLTVSFEPTRSSVERITAWIRNYVNEQMIIDLNYSPTVYGGVVIEYEGNYRDYSVNKLIDHYFSDNQAEIFNKLSK